MSTHPVMVNGQYRASTDVTERREHGRIFLLLRELTTVLAAVSVNTDAYMNTVAETDKYCLGLKVFDDHGLAGAHMCLRGIIDAFEAAGMDVPASWTPANILLDMQPKRLSEYVDEDAVPLSLGSYVAELAPCVEDMMATFARHLQMGTPAQQASRRQAVFDVLRKCESSYQSSLEDAVRAEVEAELAHIKPTNTDDGGMLTYPASLHFGAYVQVRNGRLDKQYYVAECVRHGVGGGDDSDDDIGDDSDDEAAAADMSPDEVERLYTRHCQDMDEIVQEHPYLAYVIQEDKLLHDKMVQRVDPVHQLLEDLHTAATTGQRDKAQRYRRRLDEALVSADAHDGTVGAQTRALANAAVFSQVMDWLWQVNHRRFQAQMRDIQALRTGV